MKKAFTVLTLVFVVLMMVGCSNGSTDPNNNNGGEPKFPAELVGGYNNEALSIDYTFIEWDDGYKIVSINNKTIKVQKDNYGPVGPILTLCTDYTFENNILTFIGGEVPDISDENQSWEKTRDGNN